MKTTYSKIYIDESGNTGSDINNKDQRYFIMASVRFSDEELSQIKKDINYEGELHFVKMKKYGAGRKIIKQILSHPLMDKDHLCCQIIDKTFMLYAKVTDILIETVLYDAGFDLYQNRENIRVANALYYYMEDGVNKETAADFKEAFAAMVRDRTPDSFEKFYGIVSKIRVKAEPQMDTIFSLIDESKYMIEDWLVDDIYVNDPTVTSLVALINYWFKILGEKLAVVTDDSKPIKKRMELIQRLRDIKVEKLVGYDTRKSSFPLPVVSLELVSSDSCFGIQLADIVASAVSFCENVTADKYKRFQDELKELPFRDALCLPIGPSTFDELSEPVDSSNDSDPIDFLLQNMSWPTDMR